MQVPLGLLGPLLPVDELDARLLPEVLRALQILERQPVLRPELGDRALALPPGRAPGPPARTESAL